MTSTKQIYVAAVIHAVVSALADASISLVSAVLGNSGMPNWKNAASMVLDLQTMVAAELRKLIPRPGNVVERMKLWLILGVVTMPSTVRRQTSVAGSWRNVQNVVAHLKTMSFAVLTERQ